MRTFAASLLLLGTVSIHAAPLAIAVAEQACGHCASKCCCRLPGAGGGTRSVRLMPGCPGGAAQETADMPTFRPALLPLVLELDPQPRLTPRMQLAPVGLRSLTPAPPTPPPRFV